MEQYITLAINGGQTLRRCQHERSKQRGGGQCEQAAQRGRIYCPNHPTREIAKTEMKATQNCGEFLTLISDDRAHQFIDSQNIQSRWLAIVRQYMRQTGVMR